MDMPTHVASPSETNKGLVETTAKRETCRQSVGADKIRQWPRYSKWR